MEQLHALLLASSELNFVVARFAAKAAASNSLECMHLV